MEHSKGNIGKAGNADYLELLEAQNRQLLRRLAMQGWDCLSGEGFALSSPVYVVPWTHLVLKASTESDCETQKDLYP